MATITAALQQAIGMIQDYNQTLVPPISTSLQNCFTAVQLPTKTGPQTQLMTVSTDNELMWFFPDSKSGSGWAHDTIFVDGAPDTPISRVMSFYQGEQLYAFAGYDNAGTWQLSGMMLTEANGWVPVIYGPNFQNALGQMAQPDLLIDTDGSGYIYGVSQAFNPPLFSIVGLAPGSTSFYILYQELAQPDTSYKLLPGAGAGDFVILTLSGSTATFRGAQQAASGIISLTGTTYSTDLGLGSLTADAVIPAPRGSVQSPTFLLQASNQQLYVVVGDGLPGSAAPALTQMTGGNKQPRGIQTMTAGLQASGLFTIFVIDEASNQLWSLTPPLDGGDYSWIPLGNQAMAIGAPANMAAGPELFVYSVENTTLSHVVQAVATGSWFTNPIATPSPTTQPLMEGASYTQQFTVVNTQTGAGLPGQVLNVTVDTAQVLVINSIAYHVTPTTPAVVETDPLGQITVAALASALASPVLTISGAILGDARADTSGQSQSFRGDLNLHKRIAGQDSNFPIDEASLKSAGLLPQSTNSKDSTEFANGLQQLGGVAVNIATTPTAQTVRGPAAFRFDFRDPSGLRCTRLTAAELAADLAAQTVEESVFGDVFGDVANFFKHCWDGIDYILVEVENAAAVVANFTISVEKKAQKFVLTTIDDIRDGLEVIFQAVAKFFDEVIDLIKKAIEWLKLLFDWNNYLRTKEMFSYFILQNINNVKTALTNGDLQKWVNKAAGVLENEVKSAFSSMESIFGPTTTFNGFVPASASGNNPQLQGAPPLQAGPATAQWQANGVQNGYVLSKTIASLGGQLGTLTVASQTEDPGQQLVGAFDAAFTKRQLGQALQPLEQFGEQVDSLSSFFDMVIYSLLEAAEAVTLLVIKAINAFIDLALTLAEQAIVGILDVFTRKIDIPVISALYQAIVHSELTLLDALCLCAAVPATIIYDILYGQAPFPNDSVVATFTGSPIQWPWQGQTNIEPAAAGSGEPSGAWSALLTMGILVGFVYSATDIACDTLNLASQAQTVEAGGEDPLVGTMSWIELVAAFLSWALDGPWYSAADHPSTAPEWWDCSDWMLGVVPWIVDCVFMDASQGSLARFVTGVGPAISGSLGAVQLGVGIKTAVEIGGNPEFGPADQASAILGSVSNLGKFFTYATYGGPEAGLVGGVLMGLFDLGGDLGSAITNFIPNSDDGN